MENKNNISREILIRYLAGELSDEEAWKVEKAMQEDPFLAEAMEGLELAMQKGDLPDDLEELERRINIREEGKAKSLFTPFIRVAATILVIAVSIAGVYELFFRNPDRKSEIAMEKNVSIHDSAGTVTYNDAGTAQPEPEHLSPVKEPAVKPESKAVISGGQSANPAVADESSGNESMDQISENSDAEKQMGNEHALSASPEASDTTRSIEISPSVMPAGQNPSAMSIETAAGAMKKETRFKMDRAAKSKAVTEEDELLLAGINQCHPLPGDSAYRHYIYSNLNFPVSARQKGIEGDVWIEFTVNADSSLHNFNIVKSLGGGCDEEAIRLIKQGPQWVPQMVNGKPVVSKPVYKITFSPNNPGK